MKVTEHLDRATNPLISFEIIPPPRGKTVKDIIDMVEQVDHPVHIVGAEDDVYPSGAVPDEISVLLRRASPNQDPETGPLLLQGPQRSQVAVELVVGVLPDAAGVEHHHIGLVGRVVEVRVQVDRDVPDRPGIVDQRRAPRGRDALHHRDRFG